MHTVTTRGHKVPQELLASLLADSKKPEDLIGENDLLNIPSTRWRTVFNHQRQLYLLKLALTPDTFWMDRKALDFSPQTGRIMTRDLGTDQSHTDSGHATREFKPSETFPLLGT